MEFLTNDKLTIVGAVLRAGLNVETKVRLK